MVIKSVNTSEHYIWGGNCHGWHLAKTSSLSVIQESVPPGCSEIKHYHNHSEQFFYILSGTATFELDGITYQISAENGIHVPAGKFHKLSNTTEEELRFLVISTPPSHGDRVSES